MNIDEKIKELEEKQEEILKEIEKLKMEKGEIKRENLITYQQLKDIALRLNDGQKIEWNNKEQKKYFIYYNFNKQLSKFICDYEKIAKSLNTIYCLDENFLNVVLEEIGEEKLNQLLKWGI